MENSGTILKARQNFYRISDIFIFMLVYGINGKHCVLWVALLVLPDLPDSLERDRKNFWPWESGID